MNLFPFLMVSAGVLVVGAVGNSVKLRRTLMARTANYRYLPQMVSLLVIAAQLAELVKMLEHTSIVSVTAALFLLAMMMATKSGTGNELG